jgi:hypothetical protein
MNQKALAVEDSIYRFRCSATHLAHPQAVRPRSDASNLYSSCFQIDEKQDEKTGQSLGVQTSMVKKSAATIRSQ